MSALQGILSAMAPRQQPLASERYDGLEYRWKMLVFRPAQYQKEGIAFAFVGLLLAMWYIGASINANKVKAWWVLGRED